ncbi:MAG: hypothetical protein EOM20_09060 [Spartobacteria bacterium]|nr:hypothetical protein [Spartobacteria bacterium]
MAAISNKQLSEMIGNEFQTMHKMIREGMNAAAMNKIERELERNPVLVRISALMKQMIHVEGVSPNVAAIAVSKIFYGKGE